SRGLCVVGVFPAQGRFREPLAVNPQNCNILKGLPSTATMREVSSWPRLPMFILPPNCMVPSATSLTIRPVFPSFLYFIWRKSTGQSDRFHLRLLIALTSPPRRSPLRQNIG